MRAIEALCTVAVLPEVRDWLLRHACAGDDLDAVTAGAVATAAHLHAAIIAEDADDELVDHAAALLRAMADGSGQGMSLCGDYPPARHVLAAHARRLARQKPTWARFAAAAVIADRIARLEPEQLGCTKKQRERLVDATRGSCASGAGRPSSPAARPRARAGARPGPPPAAARTAGPPADAGVASGDEDAHAGHAPRCRDRGPRRRPGRVRRLREPCRSRAARHRRPRPARGVVGTGKASAPVVAS